MSVQALALRMAALGSATASAAPRRPAVVDGDEVVTYADLDRHADQAAAALRRDGVVPGDRVAYLADDVAACLALLIGAARAGAVGVPLNSRLAPSELAAIISDCTAVVLVADAASLCALDGRDDLPVALRTVVVGPPAGAPDGTRSWDSWLAGSGPAGSVAPATAPVAADGVVVQMYTSGTTGRPKGVLLTDENLSTSIPEMCGLWLLDGTSRMLGVLPLFHIAGLGAAMGTVWSGATLVVAPDPSAVALLDTVERHRITNLVLASVLLQRLLAEAARRSEAGSPADVSSLRIVGYGAAPISQAVLHDAIRLLPCGLVQVYGLTESTGTISVLRPEDHEPGAGGAERLRSCGRPMTGLEVCLRDPVDGHEVGADEVGEITVRSARVTPGYWNAPEATAEAITPDGWLRTGDLAYADADGYLYLCDRLRDMIVTGGENVYPAEVEDVLQWHPDVAEVAVVGIPDATWGETPRAVVVLTAGATTPGEDLIDFTRARLAHFKCPRSVDFVDALPRNATGKVLRRIVREPYWAGRNRLVN